MPAAVRAPDGLLLDRLTLMYFNMYLYGQQVPEEYVDEAGYDRALARYAMQKGDAFPAWLKRRLEALGLRCSAPNVKKRAGGKEYEYDLMIVDEDERTIYLCEAKFRDIAPSSLTRSTLVPQEVEGCGGLLAQAARHAKRKQFFTSHRDAFAADLVPMSDPSEYDVKAVVVTRATPIISRVDDVEICQALEFLNRFED